MNMFNVSAVYCFLNVCVRCVLNTTSCVIVFVSCSVDVSATSTVSKRASLKCRTTNSEANTSKDTSKDTNKDTRKDTSKDSSKDSSAKGSAKDTSSPSKATRTSSRDKGSHIHKDTSTPSKDSRAPDKDTGTPTRRSQKGLRRTRQKKGNNESGDMDDIDKLFIDSDVEGKDVDDKVEQKEKTTGKGETKKVEEKPKEKVEKQGKSAAKQDDVSLYVSLIFQI